ncbi:venom allergen-1 [Drosophila bipectinata]|uniref:venom allergen-1 n=1 Tax=Drosophila bipectinata TaxID=42026 RepID=UPI001C88FD00|nr:antigen 5 like allergen Cul n 1 [Drosophila bipectinata]
MKGLRISFIIFLLEFSQAIDFCKIASCQGTEHLGCNNTMMFDKRCLRFNSLVNIGKFRRYLLTMHNKYREDVASGSLEYLPPAQRMPELMWEPYLAVLAEYHLKTCLEDLPGQPCVATDDFPDPKSNYAADIYPRPQLPESNVRQMTILTEEWMDEIYDLRDISCESAGYAIRNIINDKAAYMGCAAGKDYDLRNIHFALVCYYSAGAPEGSSLYDAGKFNASSCPHGPSGAYPNLCQTLPLND